MKESCPDCDSHEGIREILYGLPAEPINEEKYVIGGCIVSGNDPIWTCIECGWTGWSLNNSNGTKLSKWKCPICESVGRIYLFKLSEEQNMRLQNQTFRVDGHYGDSTSNVKCQKCGWMAYFLKTSSY